MVEEQYPWYARVEGPDLAQGDFLPGCPILAFPKDMSYTEFRAGIETHGRSDRPLDVEFADLVVMSQSCDLAHHKVATVMLCTHYSLGELAERDQTFSSDKARDKLREGHVHAYHLLNRCDEPGFERDFQVVDFRAVYGLPLPFARDFADTLGPRLRLLPPYREHLAQSFARYFMRVGLPIDIPAFRRK